MAEAFTFTTVDAVSFGVVVAVALPADGAEPPPEVLERLAPGERELVLGAAGRRRSELAGGRLALQRAIRTLGERAPAVLQGARGEPLLPEGLAASISHKQGLAVAIAARATHGTLGIDLEDLAPERLGIAERVLRPEELEAVAALPTARRWKGVLLRFSLKEAFYKAVHPHLGRFVGFHEASVTPDVDGTARIDLCLEPPAPMPLEVHARYHWWPGRVLSVVRVRAG